MKLKHEILDLKRRNDEVNQKIKKVSEEWPNRKKFIENAYKILLLSKLRERQTQLTSDLDKIKDYGENLKENIRDKELSLNTL